MKRTFGGALAVVMAALFLTTGTDVPGAQSIVGIHDHDPDPGEFLTVIENSGQSGWVTATLAIGANPADYGTVDFSAISNRGHTVIGRLNNGYSGPGTIPLPAEYGNFATRCRNFVQGSTGCNIWIVGNETNLATEWPYNSTTGQRDFVSPADYANCFQQVYTQIKTVRPNDAVLVQALAPWGGPYGAGTVDGQSHEANPLSWTDYMYQMLVAIDGYGITPDGIATHINSRGWDPASAFIDTSRVNAGGLNLAFGWEVHREWVMWGMPRSMWDLPLYATESNGLYYWKGGGPASSSDPSYVQNWCDLLYAEVDLWNDLSARTGMAQYHCVNLYRWCSWCDGWNIDGSPQESVILSDISDALAQGFTVPAEQGLPMDIATPTGTNVAVGATAVADSEFSANESAAEAVDGVISSSDKWTSTGASMTHWLQIDLGSERPVTGLRLHLAEAGGESETFNTRLVRFESATSTSGPWTLETAVNNLDDNSDGGGDDSVIEVAFSSARTLRHVRAFIVDAGTDDYARIPEFEVYAMTSPTEQVIDNRDFNFGVESGSWTISSLTSGPHGTSYRWNQTGTGADRVRWTPALATGSYEVQTWYTAGANRATDAHFVVNHSGGTSTVLINQETNGSQWVSLGTFTFTEGGGGYVELTDESTQSGQVVIADAVRFVPAGGGDTTPPDDPTGLFATAGEGQVSLDWNDNSEADLSGYNVYRSTTSGSGHTKINGALVTASEYTDGTAINGTTYYYVVTARDTSGNESGNSNEASATPQDTTPPAAPTNLSAAGGDSAVSLLWDANTEGDLAGYNVSRSTISGGPHAQINTSLVTTNSYLDLGLTNGTPYFYVVTAEDTTGNESVNSIEATATPAPVDTVRVEAEDYAAGGEGVGYHDTTAGNTGGAYRSDDVDIEVTTDTDGGYNVGWIANGEWVSFTGVQGGGVSYDVTLRGASDGSGGTFRLEVNGVESLGSVSFPATGGWQTWSTIDAGTVTLSAGANTLRLLLDQDGFNVNWLEFNVRDTSDTIDLDSLTMASYGGQDVDTSAYQFLDGGQILNLFGNTWKRFTVNYTITANTVIEFDYKSDGVEPEIGGIAFDNDDTIDETVSWEVYGTQIWGNQANHDYAQSGNGWIHCAIPVGQALAPGTYAYLCLINDLDAGSGSNSYFRDVRIYEATNEAIIDNDDGAPIYTTTGIWTTSGGVGYDGGTYQYAITGGSHVATWDLDVPHSGNWQVDVIYVAGSNRPTSAAYTVEASDGSHSATVDQTQSSLTWVTLGTYVFDAGSGSVLLDAATSTATGKAAIADAVRITRVY